MVIVKDFGVTDREIEPEFDNRCQYSEMFEAVRMKYPCALSETPFKKVNVYSGTIKYEVSNFKNTFEFDIIKYLSQGR